MGMEFADYLVLKAAQAEVGLSQKVARTAGGVKEGKLAELSRKVSLLSLFWNARSWAVRRLGALIVRHAANSAWSSSKNSGSMSLWMFSTEV